MREFFAALYSLFVPMYGNETDLFLKGMDDDGGFTFPSAYVPVGFFLLLGSLTMVVLFYFIINSVRFSRWYHWLMVLGSNFVLQMLVGFYLPFLDYDKGNISSQLTSVQPEHLWYFGLANAVLSLVVFTLFSFALRRWSRNCATTPIPR